MVKFVKKLECAAEPNIGNRGSCAKLSGNNVAIGPNVVFRASNHKYGKKDILINKQGHQKGRIIIEDDVWISANVVVLPDVTIKKGAVVAAGAVVTKDVEAYKVVGGIPAVNISERK